MPDLAVILVTWNVRALVLDALDTLLNDLAASALNAEVWLVDSASSDGTVAAVRERFPSVRVIASTENLGFARGNNLALQALGAAMPPVVYLLNPDTRTPLGATRKLYDALLANPHCGVVGAQLEYGDGAFQHGAFAFPGLRQLWAEFFPTPGRWIEGRFNGRYPRTVYASEQPFAVDFTLGATMMLRREVIAQTGGFDEAYFMYCEEVDWAQRIHAAGWQIYCVPAAHIVHLGGQSSGQARPSSVVHLWTSRLRYYRRYYPRWKWALARQMVLWGLRGKLRQAETVELQAAYQRIINLAEQA